MPQGPNSGPVTSANLIKLTVNGIEIDTTGAVLNNVLKYNGTKFVPAVGGGGSGTLQDAYDASSNPVRIAQDNTRSKLILRANSNGDGPLSIENNAGTQVAHFDADGALETRFLYTTSTSTDALQFEAATANAGTNNAFQFNNTTALGGTTTLATFGSNSVIKATIYNDGSFIGPKAGTSSATLHAFPSGTGDLVSVDASQSLTAKRYGRAEQTIAAAASINLDPASGESVRITLSGTAITTITSSAGTTGEIMRVQVIQDGVGGRSISGWNSSFVLIGGSYTVSSTANAIDCLTFLWDATTSKWVEISRRVQGGVATIGGSISSNQVAYGSGSNTIQGSANFTYNGSSLNVLGAVAPGATPAFKLDASDGASDWTSANDFFQMRARIGGALEKVFGFRAAANQSILNFYNPSTGGTLGQFVGTTSGVSLNTTFYPSSDVVGNLGTTTLRWGNVFTAALTNPDTGSALTVKGHRSDGGASVAVIVDSNSSYTTDGAELVSFRSGGTEFSAIERSDSAWRFRIKNDSLAATTKTGFLLQNTTAASGGTPMQVSPALALEGTMWNTTASTVGGIRMHVEPSYGNLTSLNIYHKYDGGSYSSMARICPGYANQGVKYSDATEAAFIEFSSAATGAGGMRIYAGATNVAYAIANQWGPFNDVATKNGTSSFRWTETWSRQYGGVEQTVAAAATISLDPASGESIRVTLGATAITTVNAGNGYPGEVMRVEVIQDGNGGRTIGGWSASFVFAGGTYTATATANKRDVLTFMWDNTASKWYEISRAMNL